MAVGVGLHIVLFEACSAFHSRCGLHNSRCHQFVNTLIEGFSHFVTSMTAPIASGWSGLPDGICTPLGKHRLLPRRTPGKTEHSRRTVVRPAKESMRMPRLRRARGRGRGASPAARRGASTMTLFEMGRDGLFAAVRPSVTAQLVCRPGHERPTRSHWS